MNEIDILRKNVRDLEEPDKGLYNPDAGHIEDE